VARPILRLALRVNRRTRWTAWAIAFACMVLVGSLTLIDGLSGGVDSIASRFPAGPSVYIRGDDLLTSAIDPSELASLPGNVTALRVHTGQLEINGRSWDVVVAALTDYVNGTPTTAFPLGPQDVSVDRGLRTEIVTATGLSLDAAANLSLFGASLDGLPVVAPPSSRPDMFPDTWAWVRPELLASLDAAEGGQVQALLADAPLDAAWVARLGLSPLAAVGAVGFAQGVVSEARTGFLALGLLIGVVIGLLVYSAMAIEVRARSAEIETLRSLGSSPATVAAIYEGQALFMAVLGASIGTSLGLVVANAVVSFAPLAGLPNLVFVEPSLTLVGLAYGVSLLASVVGGVVPSRQAVRRLRRPSEARPS